MLLSAIGLSAVSFGQSSLAEQIAPFLAKGTDGKNYDNKLLLGKKPVFLFYVTGGVGPETPGALRDMKRLSRELQPKARLVGVCGDYSGAVELVRKNRIPFLVVVESGVSNRLIRPLLDKYGDTTEFWSELIIPPGKVVHVWHGYNRNSLRELGRELRKYSGYAPKIDLSRYPVKLIVGTSVIIGSERPKALERKAQISGLAMGANSQCCLPAARKAARLTTHPTRENQKPNSEIQGDVPSQPNTPDIAQSRTII